MVTLDKTDLREILRQRSNYQFQNNTQTNNSTVRFIYLRDYSFDFFSRVFFVVYSRNMILTMLEDTEGENDSPDIDLVLTLLDIFSKPC